MPVAKSKKKPAAQADDTPNPLPKAPETAENELSPLIGTLNETSLHAALKKYIEPDESCHEIRLCSSVADIYSERYGVVEVQTKGLYRLKNKLERFLPEHPVQVIYPAAVEKHVFWIDPKNGELSGGRRSPGRASRFTLWRELPGLEDYLGRPGFSLTIMLLAWDEYKLLDGYGPDRKRRCSRVDRVLKGIVEECTVCEPADLFQLIPEGLVEGFTSKDFAKAAHIRPDAAQNALRILHNHRFVARIGRDKRGYRYKIMEGVPKT